MGTHGASGVNAGLSIAVLEAVADVNGVDILDIEPPLADVIDPDCLEALWEPLQGRERNANGTVSFDYAGCRVTVKSDGTVVAQRL